MSWFKRHPHLLENYKTELSSNSNYLEEWQCCGKFFITCGNIIVRTDITHKLPILIVYKNSTPYTLPLVFLLSDILLEEKAKAISNCDSIELLRASIKDNIKLYYFRHQNYDGSLCLLDADNLGDDNVEFYSADQVIERVRSWFKSILNKEPIPELPQVEAYAHYPFKNERIEIIYPESFIQTNSCQGEFYALPITILPYDGINNKIIFLGGLLLEETEEGIQQPVQFNSQIVRFPDSVQSSIDILTKKDMIIKWIDEEVLLKGYYFSVISEPPIFMNFNDIAKYIGSDDIASGFERLYKKLNNDVKSLLSPIYIGFKFINRLNIPEWHFICLEKKSNSPSLIRNSLEDFKETLCNGYIIQAVKSELFSEHSYHLRNEGCANRDLLKSKTIAIIGCGAIGSEVADVLSKAGVGRLNFVDYDVLHAHNSIRHLCSLNMIGFPKVIALKCHLKMYNPFVEYETAPFNILNTDINSYLSNDSIAISSIADDNIEGYLNEQAIINDKTIFYVRALRGGKSARIFRVIPGKDACFYCLTLYKNDNQSSFIDIPFDKKMPTLFNECNNPVRPASAADLKLISSIASKIVMGFIQKDDIDSNHWVWQSENGVYIKNQKTDYFSLINQTFIPHPECPYCSKEQEIIISINENVRRSIILEIDKDPTVETGGVLAGIIDKGIINIMYVSAPGPKAIMKVDKFNRDVAYCQTFLDKLFKESNGKIVYVGEWHFHTSGSISPSSIDLLSMNAIAKQDNYLTDTPVMIIASYDKQLSCTVHPYNKKYYNVVPKFINK